MNIGQVIKRHRVSQNVKCAGMMHGPDRPRGEPGGGTVGRTSHVRFPGSTSTSTSMLRLDVGLLNAPQNSKHNKPQHVEVLAGFEGDGARSILARAGIVAGPVRAGWTSVVNLHRKVWRQFQRC